MTPQYIAITKHGNALLSIFPNATERDPVALCKKLRRVENTMARVTLAHCNVGLSEEEQDRAEADALNRLDKILGWRVAGVPVFVNWDPRGYALKIRDEWIRDNHDKPVICDWGGYGIIAPEISKH